MLPATGRPLITSRVIGQFRHRVRRPSSGTSPPNCASVRSGFHGATSCEKESQQKSQLIRPTTGARTDDPSTWGTFDAALACHQRQGHPGIGFVFSNDDDFFGIDLDACRNPSSCLLTPWAQEIVTTIHSYTEVSPSGTGVKIVARGQMPANSRHVKKLSGVPTFGEKAPEIAIYDSGRFWCLTG